MSQRTFVQSFIFFWILSFAFLSLPHLLFAATINLSSSQSQIGQNDEYTVNVNLSVNAQDGTKYFLRGAFYSPNTSNYCGYTYNGIDWYNGPYSSNNGWQNLLPITINNSSWSGTLKAKIDPNDSGCNSSGNYNFKIERFTLSGNGTFDSQNEQAVQVMLPTSTPIPMPTSVPTNMPTPTQKPTATPTIKPTSVKNISLSPTISSSLSASLAAEVLSSSTSPTLVAAMEEKKETKTNGFVVFFIIGGIFLLSSCGILIYYWKKGMLFHGNSNE